MLPMPPSGLKRVYRSNTVSLFASRAIVIWLNELVQVSCRLCWWTQLSLLTKVFICITVNKVTDSLRNRSRLEHELAAATNFYGVELSSS